MAMNPSGTGKCDRCGRTVPNTGVAYMVTISGMDEAGEAVVFHLCTTAPDPCASRVLTRAALAKRVTSKGLPKLWRDGKDHPKP